LFLLLSSIALAACASAPIDSKAEAFGELSVPATFVWFAEAPEAGAAEATGNDASKLHLDDPGLLEELRLQAEEEFAARGITVTRASDANYIAVPRVWVELRTERRDPIYSAAIAARYEVGGVAVELFDAKSGERLWSGAATARLRDVSLGYGVDVVRYAPTNEERSWRVQAKVRSLFARLPVERVSVGRR
jgi:hypothetical protein